MGQLWGLEGEPYRRPPHAFKETSDRMETQHGIKPRWPRRFFEPPPDGNGTGRAAHDRNRKPHLIEGVTLAANHRAETVSRLAPAESIGIGPLDQRPWSAPNTGLSSPAIRSR